MQQLIHIYGNLPDLLREWIQYKDTCRCRRTKPNHGFDQGDGETTSYQCVIDARSLPLEHLLQSCATVDGVQDHGAVGGTAEVNHVQSLPDA